MSSWESLIERKVREAAASGSFDDLPGAGKPQDLTDDLLVPQDMRIVHRILKNGGYALPWMERRKELDRERERIHGELVRDADATAAIGRFRAAAQALNRRLTLHNAGLPRGVIPAPLVDVEGAVRRQA
jgi:DnaJ homologue, subfamily C, member 28, conserved domain